MTIFHQGAAPVPDIVIEAEEERILRHISQAPWLTDLSRRVQRQRAPGHDARLRNLPHGFVLTSAAVSVRAQGKVVGYPATAGADGEGEAVRSLEKGERGRDRERFPTRSSTHRHQPG